MSSFDPIPLGKGDIKKKVRMSLSSLTDIRCSGGSGRCERIEKEGISAEVLDPRTLYPLDKDLIAQSVAKTHNVVITSEEFKRGGYAGEISAFVAEELFDSLDTPCRRVCGLNTPIPFTPILEDQFLPQTVDIVNAVSKAQRQSYPPAAAQPAGMKRTGTDPCFWLQRAAL